MSLIPDIDERFDPQCWELTEAPAHYPTPVGTICRFLKGTEPPNAMWDQSARDFMPLRWRKVRDPREVTP